LVGSRRVNGLDTGNLECHVINPGNIPGKILELQYKVFGYAPSLVDSILDKKPSLIHVHFGKDATLFLPIHAQIGKPMIVTFHGLDAYQDDRWRRGQPNPTQHLYLRRRDRLIKEADRFIAVSEMCKRGLLRQGYPEDRITVHHIGIDTDAFYPATKPKPNSYVLFVGRLVDYKGCRQLIQAMQPVQEIFPELKLIIIGDGPDRGSLERLSSRTLREYQFLGSLPPSDVAVWMRGSHILSVPSKWEGLPTCVMEAMASGVPCALFDIPGTREALGEELGRYLIRNGDWRELSQMIMRLTKDHSLYEYLSAVGRRRALDRFNISRQTAVLESIYDEVVDRHPLLHA